MRDVLFTSFCEEFFSAVSSPKSVCVLSTEAYSTDCGAEIRLYSLAHWQQNHNQEQRAARHSSPLFVT